VIAGVHAVRRVRSVSSVLIPKTFTFSLGAPEMYEQLSAVRADEEEVRRRLAYWLYVYWKDNQAAIDELGRYYLGAAIALGLQLIFWSSALASNIA
jgi:hypothetical protein